MYVIELALKFTPVPLMIQRKELRDAQALYKEVRRSMEKGQPKLLELACEKFEEKKLTVLVDQLLAVQIYEKSTATSGSRRPGFSFEA